jgi:hypothetical protein
VAARRQGRPVARARPVRHLRDRGRTDRGGARQRRRAARLLQRLPPPCRRGDDRSLRLRAEPALPYHGWTYTLEGALKGTPSFNSECHFDRSEHGLVPVATDVWENWVFVRLDREGPSLAEFLGTDLIEQIRPLQLSGLHWFERRHYLFDCNWKVFVDNYLDGGYHVPHLHKGLDSVLDYKNYTIENGGRFCLQSSPLTTAKAQEDYAAVRQGDRALYYWLHPNFMINWYQGMMDTNLVLPMGVDKTEVIFDFWFADVSEVALRVQPCQHRTSASRSRTRTWRSASPCSAACIRAPIRPGACRCAAKAASTCSIACCTRISRAGT